MGLTLNDSMTLADFLAWEERQSLRHEFDGLRAFAMTGGTLAHAAIQANLAIAIGGRLRGGPCRFYGRDLKIRTGDDHIRYPDGFVSCTAGESASTVVSDPVVIFEVLRPSTAVVDRIVKAREYQATPSVQRYVMLEQDRIGARFTRASATAGPTKSWSRIRPSPFSRLGSRFLWPSSTKAWSSRRKRTFDRQARRSVGCPASAADR